jgi:hypothetical protein
VWLARCGAKFGRPSWERRKLRIFAEAFRRLPKATRDAELSSDFPEKLAKALEGFRFLGFSKYSFLGDSHRITENRPAWVLKVPREYKDRVFLVLAEVSLQFSQKK